MKPIFIVVAVCATALGQQPTAGPDAKFITRTAQANLAEVQMSAWAKDHALSDEVRQFAGKVMDDHTKLADELRGLAVNQNATLTADLDPKDSAEIERMKTLEPNVMERAYMHEVMKWHQREADAFKREVETGKDPDLKNWASRMLPKIQAHIKQGEDTERAIGMEVAGDEKPVVIEHK